MFPSDLVKLNIPFYLLSENLKVTLKMRSFSFKCQSHWQQPPLQLNYHLRFFQWPLQRSHQKYQRLLFLQALLWHQSLEGLSMTEWSMNIYQVSWKKNPLFSIFKEKSNDFLSILCPGPTSWFFLWIAVKSTKIVQTFASANVQTDENWKPAM